jgi:hypothetical protein
MVSATKKPPTAATVEGSLEAKLPMNDHGKHGFDPPWYEIIP